jgi:hypothetical protein
MDLKSFELSRKGNKTIRLKCSGYFSSSTTTTCDENTKFAAINKPAGINKLMVRFYKGVYSDIECKVAHLTYNLTMFMETRKTSSSIIINKKE